MKSNNRTLMTATVQMYDLGAVAARYAVPPATVANWIRTGELKAVNVGRTRQKNAALANLGGSADRLRVAPRGDTSGSAGRSAEAARGRRRDSVLLRWAIAPTVVRWEESDRPAPT